MDDDAFNMSIRKFLKQVGVTSQREIEQAVRAAVDAGKLSGNETLKAKARRLVLTDASKQRGDLAMYLGVVWLRFENTPIGLDGPLGLALLACLPGVGQELASVVPTLATKQPHHGMTPSDHAWTVVHTLTW